MVSGARRRGGEGGCGDGAAKAKGSDEGATRVEGDDGSGGHGDGGRVTGMMLTERRGRGWRRLRRRHGKSCGARGEAKRARAEAATGATTATAMEAARRRRDGRSRTRRRGYWRLRARWRATRAHGERRELRNFGNIYACSGMWRHPTKAFQVCRIHSISKRTIRATLL